jgi:hypothetical protein
MILIAHRGNINGPNSALENHPDYVCKALSKGYDVEIDLWFMDEKLFLGHDEPEYLINKGFLLKTGLWIHCKNIDALNYLRNIDSSNPYFFHNTDDVTLTSNGYFWTYPGKQLTQWSIAVMPEMAQFNNIETAFGICSDYMEKYENLRYENAQ